MRAALCAAAGVAVLAAAARAESPVTYEYRFSDWSTCSNACGVGTESRMAECWVKFGSSDRTRGQRRRVNEQRVSSSKCDGRGLDMPNGRYKRSCYGTTVEVDFCLFCSPEKRCCTRCVPGFELQDGACRNRELELMLELSSKNASADDMDKKWRLRKLDTCVEELVARAAGVAPARASVYAILPASAPDSAALRGAQDSAPRQAGARASVQLQRGKMGKLSPEQLRTLLQSATASRAARRGGSAAESVRRGEEACPSDLRLLSSRLVCPGAKPAEADGSCRQEDGSGRDKMSAGEELAFLLGFVFASLAVAGFSALFYKRIYQKRRLARLMAARDIQLQIVET